MEGYIVLNKLLILLYGNHQRQLAHINNHDVNNKFITNVHVDRQNGNRKQAKSGTISRSDHINEAELSSNLCDQINANDQFASESDEIICKQGKGNTTKSHDNYKSTPIANPIDFGYETHANYKRKIGTNKISRQASAKDEHDEQASKRRQSGHENLHEFAQGQTSGIINDGSRIEQEKGEKVEEKLKGEEVEEALQLGQLDHSSGIEQVNEIIQG